MTTRAAAAATSQRARQRLVQLLFQPEYGRRGRSAHRQLDSASYSYSDLKAAYLKRVQSIHPDKAKHVGQLDLDLDLNLNLNLSSIEDENEEHKLDGSNNTNSNTNSNTKSNRNATTDDPKSSSWNDHSSWDELVTQSKTKTQSKAKSNHEQFIELQEAWRSYEKVYKNTHRGRRTSESQVRGVQEDFTAFGVGCSFSDSVEETMRRADIMDQACKGWCAAGQLSDGGGGDDGTASNNHDVDRSGSRSGSRALNITTRAHVSLVGDDLFSNIVDDSNNENAASAANAPSVSTSKGATAAGTATTPKRKSLVDHLVPKFRRIHQ